MTLSALRTHANESPRGRLTIASTPGLVLAGVMVVALLQRHLVMPNADVAWLLTVAERVLDGQRLYVDVIETNPPFSVYLYLPAAALARMLHLRAELVSDVMVFMAAIACLMFCGRILRRGSFIEARQDLPLTAAAACVLLILPAACFGEREHVALIAVCPYLCVAALRGRALTVRAVDANVAGICLGLVIAIKPHFALATVPVACLVAMSRRNPRLLFTHEHVLGAFLAAMNAAAVVYLHPTFLSEMLPILARVYLPVRYGLLAFVMQFKDLLLTFAALLGCAWSRGWRGLAHPTTLAGAASLGFFASVVIQGKGMPYHFYPMVALALLTCFAATPQRDAATMRRDGWPAARLLAIAAFCLFWPWFNAGFDMRELVAPVKAAAGQPRVLALGYDFSAGPPVARAAGGTYVGRSASQWMADNVHWLQGAGNDDKALADLEAMDRNVFIEDLIGQRPDVLLIERKPEDWLAWAQHDERFAPALRDFKRGSTYPSQGMRNGVILEYEVWTRNVEPR